MNSLNEVRRTFELVESLTKMMKEINSRLAVATVTTTASASTADALDVESRQGNRLSQYTV
jgi:EAL domain-containing protein (putative c-di-GMP-specific phosphodiesterase class I)